MSQKLSHSGKGLQKIEEELATLEVADPSGVCRSLRVVEATSKVISAQTEVVREEFQKADSTLKSGLHSILEEIKRLDGDCLSMKELECVTSGVDGSIQILIESVEQVNEMLEDARKNSESACTQIAPIGTMMTGFTTFMKELSIGMHLVGLNAQVQAAHVAGGTGLETLAAQASLIARQTGSLSEQIASELDRLMLEVEATSTKFRAALIEIQDYQKAALDSGKSHCAVLHDYRDRSLLELERISRIVPEFEETLALALERVNLEKLVAPALTQYCHAMSVLNQLSAEIANSMGLEVDRVGLVDHLLKTYTMQSEVDVHERIARGISPVGEVPDDRSKYGDKSPGLTESFGDFEMFSPRSSETNEPTQQTSDLVTKVEMVTPEVSENQSGDCDLWLEPAVEEQPSVPATNQETKGAV